MHSPPRRPGLTALASILALSLVLPPLLPVPLHAQEAPAAGVTPPVRVGRLAWTRGSVSFRPAGQDGWDPATVNYPVNAGDSLWTQPDATAGMQVSDTLIALAPSTEFDLDRLDTATLTATEPEGEVYVRVGALLPGESYTLATPRGSVTIAMPGRYEIAAGTTASPTLVTVLQGAARIAGPEAVTLRSGQTASITGDRTFTVQIAPAMRDAFLDQMLARERPQPRPAVAPPALVAAMPGGADLDSYGTWASSPDYGPVWYPQVAAGWVPYREGHWAYIAPWGWTWIDDARWGFAPFHYGRWVEIGPRWAWVPVPVAVVADAPPYPVYAPALVTFFDVGAGFAAGVATGALLAGSVGWLPLAPFEPYHPYFRASPRYLREVNEHQVRNMGAFGAGPDRLDRFRNRGAATVVPASALAASRPIRPLARPASAGMLAQARPVQGREPLAPTTVTRGVTPTLARQQHLAAPPAGLAVPARPVAPGPARRAGPAGPAGHRLPPLAGPGGRVPAGRIPAGRLIGERAPGTPALRAASPGGSAPRPGVPNEAAPRGRTPSAGPMRPGAPPALPALRAPGARPTPSEAGPHPGGHPGIALPAPAVHPGQEARPAVRPEAPGLRTPGAHPAALTPRAASPEAHVPGARPEGQGVPARVAQPERPAAPHVTTPHLSVPAAPMRPTAPAYHPPVARPASVPRPEYHPVPAPRPAPRPEYRPAPAPRPASAPAYHPLPAPRPAAPRPPAPRPAAGPAPHQAAPQRDERKPQ